jgi:hypothetical protein
MSAALQSRHGTDASPFQSRLSAIVWPFKKTFSNPQTVAISHAWHTPARLAG